MRKKKVPIATAGEVREAFGKLISTLRPSWHSSKVQSCDKRERRLMFASTCPSRYSTKCSAEGPVHFLNAAAGPRDLSVQPDA